METILNEWMAHGNTASINLADPQVWLLMPSLISSFSAFFIVVFLDSLGSGFILRAFCLSFKVQWIENVFQDSLLANWLLVLRSYWFVYALIFFFFFFVYQKYDEGVYQMLGFFMGSVEYVKYKIILGPYK